MILFKAVENIPFRAIGKLFRVTLPIFMNKNPNACVENFIL